MAGRNGIRFEELDKTKKKNFTKNKPEEDNDQALEPGVEGDKCIEVSEDMSLMRNLIFICEITTKIKIPRMWIGITKDG